MKELIIWIGILVVVAVGGWFLVKNRASVPVQAPASASPIKIGAVLGLTGYAAADSLNVKKGLELAKEDLAARGINVEINYQDDKTDPKQTVSAVQYLASTYHPQAIIGPIWSFLEEAAGPVIAANKIVAYAPADTSEFVSSKSQYNFRGGPLNALMEKPLTDWLRANNKKRVAIIVSKDAWGMSVQKPFQAAAKNAGATIVVDESIQTLSSDVTSIKIIMAKIKAAKADVILLTNYDEVTTAVAKSREGLGINASVLDAGTAYPSLVSRGDISLSQAKDAYFVVAPVSKEFISKFQAKYGEVPGNYADRAYDGLMLLVEAIRNASGKDSDSVARYIREDMHYQGYAGLYEFNENGDVKGGEWVIEPVVK